MSHIQRPCFDPPLASFALAGLPRGRSAVPAPPIEGWPAGAKRTMDIVFALLLLALLGLPMMLIAAWIRLDSRGPALFRQRRVGLHGRDFFVLKFRTMHVDRAHMALEHMDRGRIGSVRMEPGPRPAARAALCRQATRDDPRVTRAGRRLRRRSIDEWPQLFNVLRGEMSLVGPRPHAPGTCAGGRPFEQVTARYAARHQVRPGITGLAQVRGWRGETETEDKLRHRVESDLEYIECWSLWRDLGIMARTIPAVVRATNAY
ncbi:MAG: sugar transferase [Acetobacteraceae bacterium]